MLGSQKVSELADVIYCVLDVDATAPHGVRQFTVGACGLDSASVVEVIRRVRTGLSAFRARVVAGRWCCVFSTLVRSGNVVGAAEGRPTRPPRQDTAMQKLRIVILGISGGRSLTRPIRDARRFPSTRS